MPGKTVLAVSTELNPVLLPHDLAIVTLCVFPKEVKTHPPKNLPTGVYSSLFITANAWKQPGSPSVGEWLNKWGHILTTEYYPVLKRNELSTHEKTWRKREHT